jgi:hypothetical protein
MERGPANRQEPCRRARKPCGRDAACVVSCPCAFRGRWNPAYFRRTEILCRLPRDFRSRTRRAHLRQPVPASPRPADDRRSRSLPLSTLQRRANPEVEGDAARARQYCVGVRIASVRRKPKRTIGAVHSTPAKFHLVGVELRLRLTIFGPSLKGRALSARRVRSQPAALGNRLTVDPRTLTPLVLVRIQVPQPNLFKCLAFILWPPPPNDGKSRRSPSALCSGRSGHPRKRGSRRQGCHWQAGSGPRASTAGRTSPCR